MGFKPKKGEAPATGQVRPSSNFERARTLASQMAAESVPDEHTVTANEQAPAVIARGALTSRSEAVESHMTPPADGLSAAAAATDAAPRLSTLAITAIRPSPFQPRGRPSHEAVRAVDEAIGRAGGISALVGSEAHATFHALTNEAKRLAELAYSVSRDGVRDPVEVRTADDGATEALSGHRRLAAAHLVGLSEVPVLHRGAMSAVQAAATVLSGNLHREDFTPWQEAVLVTEVIAQRRADALPADVRTVGAIMGYSHGRVSTLQTIRRVLSPEFLARVGDLPTIEDALARFGNYTRLEEVARMSDNERRVTALRRLLGIPDSAASPVTSTEPREVFRHRPKRSGGFTIEVNEAIEGLAVGDAATLRELFATHLARLDARLTALGRR